MSVLLLVTLGFMAEMISETGQLYLAAARLESSQIAVDNAAIELGKAQRELMNWIGRGNNYLGRLHILHHSVHACAPLNPKCAAIDRLVETKITAFSRFFLGTSNSFWNLILLRAKSSLVKSGLPKNVIKSTKNPFQLQECFNCSLAKVVCFLKHKKNIQSTQKNARFGESLDLSVGVEVKGNRLNEREWQYFLRSVRSGSF